MSLFISDFCVKLYTFRSYMLGLYINIKMYAYGYLTVSGENIF
jgi:hypothetical protein